MERTKKFILKKIQKIFLFVKICEKKCRQKELRAFTLIEMLIVLAIISILILLFVPNLIKEKKNTTCSRTFKETQGCR